MIRIAMNIDRPTMERLAVGRARTERPQDQAAVLLEKR